MAQALHLPCGPAAAGRPACARPASPRGVLAPRRSRLACRDATGPGAAAPSSEAGPPTWPSDAVRRASYSTMKHPEAANVEASVSGRLPVWLNGAYLRNGPGEYSSGGPDGMLHLFDGYSMLLRLELDGASNRVTATHRFLRSEAFKAFEATGRMRWREFGTPPPHDSALQRASQVADTILGSMGLSQGMTDNASVNVIPQPGGRALAVSEPVRATFLFDATTLETLGRVEFKDEITGDLTTAHPSVLPSGDLLNFTSTVGGGFHLFTSPAGRPTERRSLAKVPHRKPLAPAWIHDFPTGSRHTVIPEMPVHLNLAAIMGFASTPHLFLDWVPSDGARLHVVDLASGKVRRFDVPAFFVFHWANAFESEDGRYLNLDACVYEDLTIVDDLMLARLRAPAPPAGELAALQLAPSHLRRLTLDLQAPEGAAPPAWQPLIKDESSYGHFVEFPAVAAADRGRPYRYVWAAAAQRPTNAANALAKFDLDTGTCQTWAEPGGLVGEPAFVPAPNAASPDDGAVLAVVNQPDGATALVVLDGRTHAELARAVLPYGLPSGFHGAFVPSQ